MGELDEAHENWLEYKKRLLERLRTLMITFDVAEIFAKGKEEKEIYRGARATIIDAINFIKDGEI